MAGETHEEVPEGAAIFPLIPPELGVQPLLLAALHAITFLSGSADEIVQPEAADEATLRIAEYFQRLEGPALDRVREDMACLVTYAKREKWPKQLVRYLQSLLADLGVEKGKG